MWVQGGGRGGGQRGEGGLVVWLVHKKATCAVLQKLLTGGSINQLYLNTVNGSAIWFSDRPCDNYKL